MNTLALKDCVRFLTSAIISITLSCSALAQADNTALAQEKARLELEAGIEKAKADIAGHKKTQREAEALTIPPTKIEALAGSVEVKNFGAAGLVVAIDLAKELAPRLCEVIRSDQTALVYDPTTASGIISARLLDTQIILFQDSLDKALKEQDVRKAYELFTESLGMGAAVATGTIKAVAELASLFKTNITVNKTDFAEAKSLLLTAMASNCPEKLTSLGFGYAGELDTTEFDSLRKRALKLINDRAQLEVRITGVKKKLDDEKDAAKKKALQTQFEDISAVGKLVDGFIAVLKPNEIGEKSPLLVAARYLALSKRTINSNILDIDFKLEGLTIIKENSFTGQKLRLSATAITWYRLHEKAGRIIKAGVWRELAKPVQIDLRGDDAKDVFWSK